MLDEIEIIRLIFYVVTRAFQFLLIRRDFYYVFFAAVSLVRFGLKFPRSGQSCVCVLFHLASNVAREIDFMGSLNVLRLWGICECSLGAPLSVSSQFKLPLSARC